MKRICLTALAFGMGTAQLAAQAGQNTTGQTGAITTAVPFLTIAPDARAGAMGETGVAFITDGDATHWNPANLAFAQNRFGVNMSYSPWLRGLGIPDINHAYLSGFYNISENGGTAALSLRYFSLGNIQFTDEQGIETGQFNANEFALAGSYGRLITDKIAIGGGIRFVYSNLVGNAGGLNNVQPGMSGAGDIAFSYMTDFEIGGKRNELPVDLGVGVNISNIGAKMGYNTQGSQRDFLPTNLRFGYSLNFHIDDFNSVRFSNDFNKLMVPTEGGASDEPVLSGMFTSFADAPGGFKEEMREFQVSFGAEYWYNNLFSIRAGYFNETKDKGNRKFATVGAGFKFKMFSLDFVYLIPFTQNHPLQNTIRFTLGLNFGEVAS